MKNIFEGAKFGDKFLTRDGHVAIYIRLDDNPFRSINDLIDGSNKIRHELLTEYDLKIMTPSSVDINGRRYRDCKSEFDIVSRYQEPIDEEELDELADSFNYHDKNDMYNDEEIGKYFGFQEGFKAGYREQKMNV